MTKVLHLIGNGDNATMYKQGSKGVKITCNLPPFPVEGAYTTCIVSLNDALLSPMVYYHTAYHYYKQPC